MMRIRKRDGSVIEVADNYILADGDTLTVPMDLMDSKRGVVRDSRGNPAGQRPGFLYADSAADDAVDAAHQAYRDDISQRWRSDRWQSGPSKAASSAPPSSLSGDAGVAAAHEQYRRDLENRWKSR